MMISAAGSTTDLKFAPAARPFLDADVLASDSRYIVSLAENTDEINAALRLRYEVFSSEMYSVDSSESGIESDSFDSRCEHLIAVERVSGRVVGTYRINSVSGDDKISDLYSNQEFNIDILPRDIIEQGVEIGRACTSKDHRNSKVLFLMWKALARYLLTRKKRYFFGCCSIFSKEPSDGAAAHRQLADRDAIHKDLRVMPRRNAIDIYTISPSKEIELPHLFEMYLRLGAKVGGQPMYDAEFGSIDFFILFDLEQMNDRYRRMFFDRS